MYGRPRSRSRSRSPPDYRRRPYSPSRPRSPSPPRRYGDRGPGRYDDYPPPPRRYDDRSRYDSPPPPPRASRYDDQRIPPPRDYPSYERRDKYDYEPEHEYRRSPPPLPRVPPGERREYDRNDRSGPSSMMADRERDIPPPRRQRDEEQWERGRDVEELDAYDVPQSATWERRGGTKGPSELSKDVIFLGLDPELTESDFMGFLRTEHHALVDSVKIVMDRITGRSKCFGFANFSNVDAAEEFININYPAVVMPALYAHSDPRKVKIDYSTPINQSNDQGNWSQPIQHVRPSHDGMRDIGPPGPGKRILLLRGLNYHSTPSEIIWRLSQEIARLVGKAGREKEAERAIVRLVQIVDRGARSSWGYGFVELATPELAAALLPFLISPESQPQGFQISQFPVAASFTNPNTFIPVPAGPLGGEFLIHASSNGGFGSDTIDIQNGTGTWVGYWHELGGALETVPQGALRISDDGQLEPLSVDLRNFLGPLAGAASGAQGHGQSQAQSTNVAASIPAGPISISMTGMQPIKLGAKGKKLEEEGFVAPPTKNLLHEEEEDVVGKDTVLLSRTKGVASIIAPSKGKIAKNISKWNTKKNELATPLPSEPARPKGISAANLTLGVRKPQPQVQSQVKDQSQSKPQSQASSSPQAAPEDFDYTETSTLSTTGKVACLLCQRQFKSVDILKKHTQQSDLHKARSFYVYIHLEYYHATNLLDAAICEAGRKRKQASDAAGSGSTSSPSTATATDPSAIASASAGVEEPKYRDRAAERREAFHQPDRPSHADLAAAAVYVSTKKRWAEGPKPAEPKPKPEIIEKGLEPGKDESNRGNQLLAKMGWKAGSGLGAGGEGRVDPVMVQQFAERAGLGSSKGVEAGRWQGPGGFQTRALDMAKERYGSGSPGAGGGSGSGGASK